MARITPKTNWIANDIPVAADLNRIESNNGQAFTELDAEAAARIAAVSAEAASRVAGDAAVQSNLTTHINDAGAVHGATNAATANSNMRRDAAGRAKVAAPSAADDIARKDNVDAVQSNLTAHVNITSGTVHGASVAATANVLVLRDINGNSKFASPVNSEDAATKAYVDGVGTNGFTGNTIMRRDADGRSKVIAPFESGDIANKLYVDIIYPDLTSDAGSNSFNIGTTLLVQHTTTVNRNVAVNIYLTAGNQAFNMTSGTSVSGTWRARGSYIISSGVALVLCQRVS
jgi:hypothetical protein